MYLHPSFRRSLALGLLAKLLYCGAALAATSSEARPGDTPDPNATAVASGTSG
jgi:hypothetical protein